MDAGNKAAASSTTGIESPVLVFSLSRCTMIELLKLRRVRAMAHINLTESRYRISISPKPVALTVEQRTDYIKKSKRF